MAWAFDNTDTPANVTTALGTYLNNLAGVERSFFNGIKNTITLMLTIVTSPKVRVQTTGDFDGAHWRTQLLIDPVNAVDPANNPLQLP